MKRIKVFLKALAFYLYNSFVTEVPFYAIRHLYLRWVLKIKVGKGSAVHTGCYFSGSNVTIGSHTVINRKCYLDGRASLTIGSNVSISPEAYILSLDHDPNSSSFSTVPSETKIMDRSWIGVRALILPGVMIEMGTVVGAGAVVTKTYEPYSIIAGVPAKLIGTRNSNLNYELSYLPLFNTDIQF